MAHRAILRETGGLVRRTVRTVIIRQVAVNARAAGQTKIAIDVALCALHRCVKASQDESGFAVVERRSHPVACCVAGIARSGKPCSRVIRIGRSFEVL